MVFFVCSYFTFAVFVAENGCLSTRGKSVRNSDKRLVIFPLMVLAEYSSLGDATQQGTILWASTCRAEIKDNTIKLQEICVIWLWRTQKIIIIIIEKEILWPVWRECLLEVPFSQLPATAEALWGGRSPSPRPQSCGQSRSRGARRQLLRAADGTGCSSVCIPVCWRYASIISWLRVGGF